MWDLAMRGDDVRTESLFSYLSCEARVPEDHPLRPIRTLVDQALTVLSPAFDQLYSDIGRPSIPPEKLLRALLLQALYSVRSERQLMEQLDYNLLFRWFVGLAMDAPIWNVTVFTKNRDRLLDGEVAAKFFQAVLGQAEVRALLSDEHFSVDGTLIEAFASMKSFKPKDEAGGEPPAGDAGGGRNRERAFHGARRRNDTHASTTDPDARLFRKGRGKEAKLCHMGHLLMENRNGLIVDALVTQASGRARCGRGHAGPPDGPAPRHARRRQGLRCGGFRRRSARPERHPARRPEYVRPALGDRRSDHAPPRLRREPARAQADRGGVRLDQDRGRSAQDPAPRHRAGRLDVHADRRRLQPGPAAQAAGGMLIMPGLRPARPGVDSDGPEHLETLAEAPFPTSKRGNQAGNDLISAAW
jgi:transposase